MNDSIYSDPAVRAAIAETNAAETNPPFVQCAARCTNDAEGNGMCTEHQYTDLAYPGARDDRPFGFTPNPADGPQLYYTDGHCWIRLDRDERVLISVDRRVVEFISALLRCAHRAVNLTRTTNPDGSPQDRT